MRLPTSPLRRRVVTVHSYPKSFPEAVQILTGEPGEAQPEADPAPSPAFRLPLRNVTNANILNYLTQAQTLRFHCRSCHLNTFAGTHLVGEQGVPTIKHMSNCIALMLSLIHISRHHRSCADKKNKAEKFSNQQNQKLIPSLAVDGVDALSLIHI